MWRCRVGCQVQAAAGAAAGYLKGAGYDNNMQVPPFDLSISQLWNAGCW